MTIPQSIGIPNKRLRAMAEPITSAKSQAAMAISQNIQRKKLTLGLKWSLQACARSLSVTIPNFSDRCCNRIANMLEIRITESSV